MPTLTRDADEHLTKSEPGMAPTGLHSWAQYRSLSEVSKLVEGTRVRVPI
jgi:hypothetical protein